jgi:hypothetical protein
MLNNDKDLTKKSATSHVDTSFFCKPLHCIVEPDYVQPLGRQLADITAGISCFFIEVMPRSDSAQTGLYHNLTVMILSQYSQEYL